MKILRVEPPLELRYGVGYRCFAGWSWPQRAPQGGEPRVWLVPNSPALGRAFNCHCGSPGGSLLRNCANQHDCCGRSVPRFADTGCFSRSLRHFLRTARVAGAAGRAADPLAGDLRPGIYVPDFGTGRSRRQGCLSRPEAEYALLRGIRPNDHAGDGSGRGDGFPFFASKAGSSRPADRAPGGRGFGDSFPKRLASGRGGFPSKGAWLIYLGFGAMGGGVRNRVIRGRGKRGRPHFPPGVEHALRKN